MCKTLLAVLASCWKLRLEYYKNITAACTLGLCAKIKKGLEGGAGQVEVGITGMKKVMFSE